MLVPALVENPLLQSRSEQSTLNVEVGVTAAKTVPFVTSSVTLTPERGDDEPTNSVFVANLWTQRQSKRFVISSDSSHHSSTNAADDEVTSFVRFFVPPHPLMTIAIATTAIAGGTSAPVPRVGAEPVPRSIFRDFASPSTAKADVVGPSQPAGTKVSTDTFFISQDIDSKTLQQIYVPKWNVINDSSLDDPEVCHSMVNQLAPLKLTGLLRDKDAEVASMKAQLSLKEAEAAEAIHLRGQIVTVEATEAAQVSKLGGLKEQNAVLEGQIVTLESAAIIKDTELLSSNAQIAKMTHNLSNLQLSSDELSIKASSL
ncbi:hypothetical protein Tco_1231274 [Tanacetum coccineum]